MTSTIRDLTELTAVAPNDYLLISDTSDTTNRDKRISQLNLVGGALTGGGTLATGGFTLTVPATGVAVLKSGTPVAGRTLSWLDANTVQDSGFLATDVARLSVAQTFSALKTFSAGLTFGQSTLNYFDAGSWTPVLAFGGLSTGIAYGTQVGRYVTIGNLNLIWARMALTNKGSATGSATVSGLLTPSQAGGPRFVGSAYVQTITYTGMIQIHLGSAASSINIEQVDTAGTVTILTNTNFANTSNLEIFLSYLS